MLDCTWYFWVSESLHRMRYRKELTSANAPLSFFMRKGGDVRSFKNANSSHWPILVQTVFSLLHYPLQYVTLYKLMIILYSTAWVHKQRKPCRLGD